MLNKLILVLNCGSSSFKFSIIDPIKEITYLSGISENFHYLKTIICWKIINLKNKYENIGKKISYEEIIRFVLLALTDRHYIYMNNVVGIGHRVVHGGKKNLSSVLINNNIYNDIKKSSIFAPLHNPINLLGIKISLKIFPKMKDKNVAVFDTTFHQTIPKYAYLYGIPYYFYSKYFIRRYGAHGINHSYISKKTSFLLKKNIQKLNIISCHLGSGSSVTAIVNGESVDTSMGLTPLEGLIMGTRCGDIDPSIIIYMSTILKIKISEINNILTKYSGVLGINSISSDFKFLEKKYYKNKIIKLSINMFCYRLAKYIASYIVTMKKNNLDAIVFTGGIGENSVLIRNNTIKKLSFLGFFIDVKKNIKIFDGKIGFINSFNSPAIIVIPANENQVIADDTLKLLIK